MRQMTNPDNSLDLALFLDGFHGQVSDERECSKNRGSLVHVQYTEYTVRGD